MKVILISNLLLIFIMVSLSKKWQIEIIHKSLLEVKNHHPNVTAIVNAANVRMRGGETLSDSIQLVS